MYTRAMEYARDYAMYAAIFGFFGMMWFGMAQENPPKSWRVWLGVGSVVSVLIALLGVYLAVTNWQAVTGLDDKRAYITFGITVATEVALIAIGAMLLAKRWPHLISAWIALVVGAHFLPLAWVFKDPALYLLSTLTCLTPVAGIALTKKTGVSVSAITCVGMGAILLIFALRGLYLFFL